jgi:hypothetical protein
MSDGGQRSVSFEELGTLRAKTEALSQFLDQQLRAHVETLRTLMAPQRVLGRYVGSKDVVAGADRAFEHLQEQFRSIAPSFGLAADLADDELSDLENIPDLYVWEYAHQAKTEHDGKVLTLTSPVRWVLTYRSGYSLPQFRQAVAGKGERMTRDLRRFVQYALVMQMVIKGQPKLTRLLKDLRYDVTFDHLPGLDALPLTTLHACLSSFRPSDDVLVTATKFSGVPAFIELIDLESIRNLEDPLKSKFESLVR